MPTIELSAETIKTLTPPATGKVDYYDTAITGFIVEVRSTGGMTYYLKYRDSHNKLKQFKIGAVKDLSFTKAASQAQALRAKVVLGQSPMEERVTKRATPTLAEFSESRYMVYAKATKRSYLCDDSLLRIHILPKFGQVHMDDISQHAVTEFFHGKHAAGYAKGTCNRILILLRYMYNLALKWKIPGVTENPTAEIVLFDVRDCARQRYLNQEEVQRLYQAVKQSQSPMLQYIVPMLLLTGARRREVLDAKWEDFDYQRRLWKIPKTKAGRPRWVPMSDGVMRLLASVPRFPNCPWAFPNTKTLQPIVSGFASWDTARKKAGLAGVRQHDLRHSFASFCVNAGRSLYEVQKLLGHQQVSTTQVYSHLAPETLLAATDAVAHATGLLLEGQAERVVTSLPVVISQTSGNVIEAEVIEDVMLEVEKLAA
jgi:integrase